MHRYQIRAFKGEDTTQFRELIELAANNLGAKIMWETPGASSTLLRLSDTGDLHTVYLHEDSPFVKTIYLEIGRVSGLPWIDLRIPGAPLWCYTLYHGGEKKDDFCPCPELWDDAADSADAEQRQRWKGNPQMLANLWDVPVARIERYLVMWGLEKPRWNDRNQGHRFKLQGKAYPNDEYGYGCGEQLIDFWHALGFGDIHETKHTLI